MESNGNLSQVVFREIWQKLKEWVGLFRFAKYNECNSPGGQRRRRWEESKILGILRGCKGALQGDCAPRQEFGFKLLFVPDKSGRGWLPHPSTYSTRPNKAFKQITNPTFLVNGFVECYFGSIIERRWHPRQEARPPEREASSGVRRINEGLFQSPTALVDHL